jgi:hypothetical protein
MKKFKQFLEENLIKQSLLEWRPPYPPEQYFPNLGDNPLNPNLPLDELPGGYQLWQRRPNNRPSDPGSRSPFFIYDNNGNIIGTDLNGDGQPDTEEEIREWIESGGLDNIPSDWIGDQDSIGARFLLFLRAWWEIGQWVIPGARIGRSVYLFLRLIIGAIQGGMVITDFLDIQSLLRFLIENRDLFPQLYQTLQELIEYLGQEGFNNLLEAFALFWFTGNTGSNSSTPKQFYRRDENGFYQLWKFNPLTGTWEPFGIPIGLEEYLQMCQGSGSNCPPLENPGNPFPFKPPQPPKSPTYNGEPFDPSEIPSYRPLPTNNHWNQQIPGSNQIDPDPNPFPWPQM